MEERTKIGLMWSLRITLLIFGIIAVYQIVPYFTMILRAFTTLIENASHSTMSDEFKLGILSIGCYLSVIIINCIVNIVEKLYQIFNKKAFNLSRD